MPVPATTEVIRGAFAQLVRKKVSNQSAFEINKQIRTAHPGTYDPVAASKLNTVVAGLRIGPYPKAGLAEFGFEYWYNYFFKELPDANKNEFAAHVVNDDGSFRGEASKSAADWKVIFQGMLEKGFKAFTAADHLTASQVLEHAALDPENELQSRQVSVVFRGDGRLPDMIKQQGGTARQSKVDALRTGRNMAKTWHPFNKQGNKIWVRNGANTDNCLFSAVSITPQFGVATKFPLLDDLRGSNPSAIGHSIVVIRPRGGPAPVTPRPGPKVAQAYQAGLAKNATPTETRTLLASRTNIYCVRLRDVYNTQNYQMGSAFPEYATTRISWMDHLLWFGVTRIHFDERDGNAGHLIVITGHKWLQDLNTISGVLLNPDGLLKLRTFTNDVVQRGSLVNGTGGIVSMPAGGPPPFDIVSIRDLWVAGRPPPVQAAVPSATSSRPTPGRVTIPGAFTHRT